MSSETIEITDVAISSVSLTGGLVFCVSLFLQMIKIIGTKSTGDLSYGWAILSILAIIAGLIYGIHFNLWPIYVANSLQTLLSVLILILKIIYDRKEKEKQRKKIGYVFSV